MAKKNKQKKTAEQNLVAKHAKTFNLAHVFEDRKRQQSVVRLSIREVGIIS